MGKYILILTNSSGYSWVHTYPWDGGAQHQRFETYGGAEYVGETQRKNYDIIDYQIVKVG